MLMLILLLFNELPKAEKNIGNNNIDIPKLMLSIQTKIQIEAQVHNSSPDIILFSSIRISNSLVSDFNAEVEAYIL